MMIINTPEIVEEKEHVKLRASYEMDGKTDYLWFSFSKDYKDYLVTENVDAFLVGLLLLAMKKGEDINVKGALSQRLYYSLNNYLISALSFAEPNLKKVKVTADKLNATNLNVGGSIGTGLSGGVDSFAVICDHLNVKEQYRINRFTFLNAGSHGDNGGDFARKLFNDRYTMVKKYADECNIEVMAIDTNINEILMMEHVYSHTIRDVACILTLQKLFKYYYYASTYRFDHYELSNYMCQGSYDILSLNMLSTESISFFSAVSQYTRVERTEKISEYEPTYRYLNVCTVSSSTGIVQNCSVCPKCLRTQVTLELLGKYHLYNKVFNISEYKKKKEKYIGCVLANKNDDIYCNEIAELIKLKKYKVTLKSYFYYIAIYARNALLYIYEEIKRKVRS